MANIIDQKERTRPKDKQELLYAYRFASDRSSDSKRLGQPGQDFIAYSATPERLCFALCDGVSQSFLGDLGASLVGKALIYWLEKECKVSDTNQEIQLSLDRFLKSITPHASTQVANQVLPDHLPDLLREVLEEKRSLGSQSMFFGVRIDLPGKLYPRGRLICAWMGDSRIRIWDEKRERTGELGNNLQTAERWSTLTGPVNGLPHVFTDSLFAPNGKPKVSRLLAYSDGLAVMDTMQDPLTNAQLDNIIDQLAELPNSDDVSLFEFWLGRAPNNLHQPLERAVILPITEIPIEPVALSPEPIEAIEPPPIPGSVTEETIPIKLIKRSKVSLMIGILLILITFGLVLGFRNQIIGVIWPESTSTPTPTSTSTLLPTATPSRTVTASPSITPSSSPTLTPTSTPTRKPSATATITQTTTPQFQPSIVLPTTITPSPVGTGY